MMALAISCVPSPASQAPPIDARESTTMCAFANLALSFVAGACVVAAAPRAGDFTEVADALGGAAHWLKLPPGARVRPYGPLDHQGKSAQQALTAWIDARAHGVVPQTSSAALQRMERYLESAFDSFVAQHAPSADNVWDNIIDPPSPL